MTERGNDTPPLGGFEELDEALAGLPSGARVCLYRSTPSYAGPGFLANYDAGADTIADLEGIVQREWGGGRYYIRVQKPSPNGGLRYAKGNWPLEISGAPLKNGRPMDRDGNVVERVQAQPMGAPMPYYPPPMQQPVGSDVNQALLGFVQQLMQGNTSQGVDVAKALSDLNGQLLNSAMQQAHSVTTQPDALGQIERTIEVIGKLGALTGKSESLDVLDDDADPLAKLAGPLLKRFADGKMNGPPQPTMVPDGQGGFMVQTPQGWQRMIPASAPAQPSPVQPPRVQPPESPVQTQKSPVQGAATCAPSESRESQPMDYTPEDVADYVSALGEADAVQWVGNVVQSLPLSVAQSLAQSLSPNVVKIKEG